MSKIPKKRARKGGGFKKTAKTLRASADRRKPDELEQPEDPAELGDQVVDIEQLQSDPANLRLRTDRNRGAIDGSLERFGAARSIVIDSKGIVRAGNGTIDGARRRGIKRVRIVEGKPDELIAVRRKDWSEAEAVQYAIADNRSSELAKWDLEGLARTLPGLTDAELAGVGFTKKELDSIVRKAGGENEGEGEDNTPGSDAASAPVSRLGEIYELGPHRLLCGDAYDAEERARLLDGLGIDLLATDPPYGISLLTKPGKIGGDRLAKNQVYQPVIGDDEPFDPAFLLAIPAARRVLWGAQNYSSRLPDRGAWLVWDKGRPEGTTFGEAELAWTDAEGRAVRMLRCVWNGMIREGESEARAHPTQKPLKLMAEVIEMFTDKAGQLVFDPFLGSGSTLIAAARLKRRCFGLELSPAYCDVIRKRWGAHALQNGLDSGDGL